MGTGKKQKLDNMGLQRKICFPDTQFLQSEYLRAGFFPIDPYSSFYALFVAILVSHNSFFLYRPKIQDAHDEHFRIYSSLVIPSGFHNLGISSKTSFSYPKTFLSVGISSKTSISYPKTFHSVGISNETSISYPKTFLSVGISSKTSFSYPKTFHSVGISNETSFSYPKTFFSVGISSKTSFPYPQTFIVWVSAAK